jgi:succinyl-CoA synthetase alpha subunit
MTQRPDGASTLTTAPALIDPVDLATAALERVPADPAAATAEDIAVISAAASGVLRLATELRDRGAALIVAITHDEIEPREARDELRWLQALGERSLVAGRRLDDHLLPALRARGIDPGQLAAGHSNHPSKEQ